MVREEFEMVKKGQFYEDQYAPSEEICVPLNASLVAQMVKNPPVEDLSSFPGLGRPLQKGTITHSSILAWRITGKRSPWKRATVHWVTKI